MKFLKSTLSIVALFATGSIFSKAINLNATAATSRSKAPVARAAATKQQTPTKTAAQTQRGRTNTTQQPTQSGKTYPQLVTMIRNEKNAWNKETKMLNSFFADKISEMALASDLEDYQLDALLQTARDYHAIFTGTDDVTVLNKLAKQRKDYVAWFNMGKFGEDEE